MPVHKTSHDDSGYLLRREGVDVFFDRANLQRTDDAALLLGNRIVAVVDLGVLEEDAEEIRRIGDRG